MDDSFECIFNTQNRTLNTMFAYDDAIDHIFISQI